MVDIFLLILFGLPLLITLIVFYLNRRKSWLKKIIISVCTFAGTEIILVGLFVFLVISITKDMNFGETMSSVEPSQYISYLEKYSTPKHTTHFPKKIPPAADSYAIYYTPSFLQGAEGIELSYILPNQAFNSEMDRLRRKAVSEKMGDDGKIEIILGEENRSPGTHDWNHGLRYGANFDLEKREVKYWARRW